MIIEAANVPQEVVREMNYQNASWMEQAKSNLNGLDKQKNSNDQMELAHDLENKDNVNQQQCYEIQRKIHVLSPSTVVSLYASLPKFQNLWDCNFNKQNTADQEYDRFNDTFYVQNQLIIDKHNFAVLNNGTTVIPGCIYSNSVTQQMYYVIQIEQLPPQWFRNWQNHLNTTKSKRQWLQQVKTSDVSAWYPEINVKVRLLKPTKIPRKQGFDVDIKPQNLRVRAEMPWVEYPEQDVIFWEISRDGRFREIELPTPHKQMAQVGQNGHCLMMRASADGWTYSGFTRSKTEATVNSFYWAPLNIPKSLMFKKQWSMAMTNCPGTISKAHWARVNMQEWKDMYQTGSLCWIDNKCEFVPSVMCFVVCDMELQTLYQRKRGCNTNSNADGRYFLGRTAGSKWPLNDKSLFSMNVCINGQTLYDIWKTLRVDIPSFEPKMYKKCSKQCGIGIGVTTAPVDTWADWDIDCMPKMVTALHHTMVLKGVAPKMLYILWTQIHTLAQNKFQEIHTILIWQTILNQEYHGTNCMDCWTIDRVLNLFASNQIQKCWSKYLQTCLVFFVLFDHIPQIKLWTQMLCLFMLISNCRSDSMRIRLEKFAKKLFIQGMCDATVLVYVW